MRAFRPIALTASLLTLAGAGTVVGKATASDLVGHLSVNDNTADAKTIAAFDRHVGAQSARADDSSGASATNASAV